MSANATLLGQHVLARRTELGKSQKELADEGGPSDTTLSKLENGLVDNVANHTLKRLDQVLGWRPGSARAIYYAGADPIRADAVHSGSAAGTVTTSGAAMSPAALEKLDQIQERLDQIQAAVAALRGDVEPDEQ